MLTALAPLNPVPKPADVAPPSSSSAPEAGERFADALGRSRATHGLQAPAPGEPAAAGPAVAAVAAEQVAAADPTEAATLPTVAVPPGVAGARAAGHARIATRLAPALPDSASGAPPADEAHVEAPQQPATEPAQGQPTAAPVAQAPTDWMAALRIPEPAVQRGTTSAMGAERPAAAEAPVVLPPALASDASPWPPADGSGGAAASESAARSVVSPVSSHGSIAAALDAAGPAAAPTAAHERPSPLQEAVVGAHPAQALLSGAGGLQLRGFDAAALAPITLAAPVHSPEFAQVLGAQVSVLAREGVQQAQLHLHPAEMGPISIQIEMTGTQARIDFTAGVAATRQVIETGLPELASALRDQGLTLSGGGVFQQPPERREPQARPAAEGAVRSHHGQPPTEGVPGAARPAMRVPIGMLDLYA